MCVLFTAAAAALWEVEVGELEELSTAPSGASSTELQRTGERPSDSRPEAGWPWGPSNGDSGPSGEGGPVPGPPRAPDPCLQIQQ